MNRPAMGSADLIGSPSIPWVEPSRPLGRIARFGVALGMCAALGVGVLAGPQVAAPHHSVTRMSTHVAVRLATAADTSGITGGPGNV